MAEVRDRDVHQDPTPRIGGIAIFAAVLLVVLAIVGLKPDLLSFSADKFLGIDRNLFGLIAAMIILAAVSLVDDFRGLSPIIRLIFQIIAASLVVYFGISIPWISNPFGPHFILGNLAPLFVVVWLVVIANAVNWLDSIDGLSGGVASISLAVLYYLSISPHVDQPANALLAIIVFGAIVGFLPHNFSKRKAFLGETGAILIGFLIGVIAIISGGKVATAFLVLAIPFLDAIVVFFARIFAHQSPFKADQRHLPHKLMALGMKRWQIDLVYYVASLALGLVALNTQTAGKITAGAVALILMAALVAYYSWALRKKAATLPEPQNT